MKFLRRYFKVLGQVVNVENKTKLTELRDMFLLQKIETE